MLFDGSLTGTGTVIRWFLSTKKRDEALGHGGGELGRVDVPRMGRDRDVGADARRSACEEAGVGRRVPERAAGTFGIDSPSVGTMITIGSASPR